MKTSENGINAPFIVNWPGTISEGIVTDALVDFTDMYPTVLEMAGIDVSGISHVINFDMPGTAETYTHRTGRTGRASCAGEAFTFVTADDHKMLRALERTFGKKMVYKRDIGIIGISENSVEARTINDFPKVRKRVESPRGHRTSKRNQAVAFDFGI